MRTVNSWSDFNGCECLGVQSGGGPWFSQLYQTSWFWNALVFSSCIGVKHLNCHFDVALKCTAISLIRNPNLRLISLIMSLDMDESRTEDERSRIHARCLPLIVSSLKSSYNLKEFKLMLRRLTLWSIHQVWKHLQLQLYTLKRFQVTGQWCMFNSDCYYTEDVRCWPYGRCPEFSSVK